MSYRICLITGLNQEALVAIHTVADQQNDIDVQFQHLSESEIKKNKQRHGNNQVNLSKVLEITPN